LRTNKQGHFYHSQATKSKLGNWRITLDGHFFASKLEASVYQFLRLRERAGEIKITHLQSRIHLTDARILYIPDFQCLNLKTQSVFYVEAKGFETPDWKIKKRLWFHYGPAPLEIWRGTHSRPFLDEIVTPKNLSISNLKSENEISSSSDAALLGGGWERNSAPPSTREGGDV
jgi:hypothetical protein